MKAIEILIVIEKEKLRRLNNLAEIAMGRRYNKTLRDEEQAYEALDSVTRELIALNGDEARRMIDGVNSLILKEDARALFSIDENITYKAKGEFAHALREKLKSKDFDKAFSPST